MHANNKTIPVRPELVEGPFDKLRANGVWKNGVWANGVWANGVWKNGGVSCAKFTSMCHSP